MAQPRPNLDLARVYLRAHDAEITERTWAEMMAAYAERGRDSSRERCRRAFAGHDFDPIRDLARIDTRAEDLLRVLATGKPSVNHYLRRLINFAGAGAGCRGLLLPQRRGRSRRGGSPAPSRRRRASEPSCARRANGVAAAAGHRPD